MAIKNRRELLEIIKNRIGDENTDENIAFLEDINDTFNDLENKASNNVNWEQKYNENDAAWRKKYTERFYGDIDTEPPEPPAQPKVYSFENLFK